MAHLSGARSRGPDESENSMSNFEKSVGASVEIVHLRASQCFVAN